MPQVTKMKNKSRFVCPVRPFPRRNGCYDFPLCYCCCTFCMFAYSSCCLTTCASFCFIVRHIVAPKRPPPPLLHVHGSTSDEIHVYYHWLSFLTTAEDDPQTFYQSCTIVPKLPLLLLVPREFVCFQILRRGCFSWKRVGSGSRRLKAFRLKRRGEEGGAVSPSPRKTTHLENATWRGFGRTASHLDTNQSNCGSRAGAPAGPQASKV